jgi:tetratricopeptide (TPR) repeat protein
MDAVTHKPECLLHIGHSKTGSTSIQNAMAAHRDALAERGVIYPKTPGWSNHALIPASAAPPPLRERGIHPAFWGGLPPGDRIERFLDEFPAEMRDLPETARLVVLSSEQCVYILPDVASIHRLKAFLEPLFSRIRIVVYLRRQDTHFASAYTQKLRDGIVETPRLPDEGAERSEYDYAGLLWRWAKVFGVEAVVPRLFDRAELVGGDVIDDVLSLCGADGAVPADDQWRASNPSTDAVGQALMVAVGRAMAGGNGQSASLSDPVWRRFTEIMTAERPGRGWQPPAEMARLFVERFAEGNEWIRERWFPGRATLFSTEYGAASGDFPAEETLLAPMSAFVARLAARHLALEVEKHMEVAAVLARRREPEKAIRWLSRAVALDETAPAPRLELAALLGELGRTELAKAHLRVAADRLPGDDARLQELQRRMQRGSTPPLPS